MKKIEFNKNRQISGVITETREREQISTLSYGNDDFFLEIDELLSKNNISIGSNSRYAALKKAYKQGDHNTQLIAHQEASQLLQIARYILSDEIWRNDIIMSFTNDPVSPTKRSKHTPGRDKQFELYLAARFKMAQISTTREEPDLLCRIDDYEFTVAAKRIKSRNQLFKRIKEAAKQIIKSKKPGLIAIDISPLQSEYYSPHKILELDNFKKAANDFIDIEFENKLNEIRKHTSNNRVIGIIAFFTFCAKHTNNHTKLIAEFHNGSRLCKPNSEKAHHMWNIVDRLSKSA